MRKLDDDLIEEKSIATAFPHRENSIGVIYVKNGRIFITRRFCEIGIKMTNESHDREIQSFEDLQNIIAKDLLQSEDNS